MLYNDMINDSNDYLGCGCMGMIAVAVGALAIDPQLGLGVFAGSFIIFLILGFIQDRIDKKRSKIEEEKKRKQEEEEKEKARLSLEEKMREYEISRLEITKNQYFPKKGYHEDIINYLHNNYVYCLYHFTSYENLESIKKYGGLMSWKTLEDNEIESTSPGGDSLSRNLDRSQNLEDFVHLSFCQDHPMAYRHILSGKKMVLLKIMLDVVTWKDTMFTNMNATDRNHSIGDSFDYIKSLDLSAVNQPFVKRTDINFKQRQAEILVKSVIPKEYIINLEHPDYLPQVEYDNGWYFESSRFFTEEEKLEVICAQVVKGTDDKLMACFLMKLGGKSYIPMSSRSNLKEGDKIDMNSVRILTLSREERCGSKFIPEKYTNTTSRIEE